MKKLVVTLVLLSVSAVQAKSLVCSGDGTITKVTVSSTAVNIQYTDNRNVKLNAFETLKTVSQGQNGTAILIKEIGPQSGGEILNAAMLRVSQGGKKADLAFDGSVYVLNCKTK